MMDGFDGERTRDFGRHVEELRDRMKALAPTGGVSCEEACRSPLWSRQATSSSVPWGAGILGQPARNTSQRVRQPLGSQVRLTSTGSDLEEEGVESLLVRQLQLENAELLAENAVLQRELARLTDGMRSLAWRFDKELEQEKIRHPTYGESPGDQLTILMKEQLATYRVDFDEERQRSARMRERNIFLESQLEEAKRTIESQEKKLIMYAQLVAGPMPTELTLRPRSGSGSTSRSVPTTPSYQTIQTFGFRQCHVPPSSLVGRQHEMERVTEVCERDRPNTNDRLPRACESPRLSERVDYAPVEQTTRFWYDDDEVNAKSIRLLARARRRSLPI